MSVLDSMKPNEGTGMTDEKMVTVRWETCECEYRSKYCDEYHFGVARIPLEKIKQWIEEGR